MLSFGSQIMIISHVDKAIIGIPYQTRQYCVYIDLGL